MGANKKDFDVVLSASPLPGLHLPAAGARHHFAAFGGQRLERQRSFESMSRTSVELHYIFSPFIIQYFHKG